MALGGDKAETGLHGWAAVVGSITQAACVFVDGSDAKAASGVRDPFGI